MAVYFWDSNAIAKIYHAEIGTTVATKLFRDIHAVHIISRLSTVEVVSTFAKLLRMKVIKGQNFDRIYRRFLRDINFKKWRVGTFKAAHFDQARTLLRKHGKQHALRTLDSLQLAVAVAVQDKLTITNFISSDKILNKIVEMEGISVLDLEEVEHQQISP